MGGCPGKWAWRLGLVPIGSNRTAPNLDRSANERIKPAALSLELKHAVDFHGNAHRQGKNADGTSRRQPVRTE
jgi:hypothetical protein